MTPCIASPDDGDEFPTDEGCHILEIRNTADDPAVSIARARVAPGVCTRLHALEKVEERYVIISGTGEVEVGKLPPTIVKTGDVVAIPAGLSQRIRNTGEHDLIFHAICTPRFTPECYREL